MSTQLREHLIKYLEQRGWQRPTSEGPVGGLWAHAGTSMMVPVPKDLTTRDVVWETILDRLAAVENKTAPMVAASITSWATDITYLRASNDVVIADTIPLETGVTMLQNSWQMLRSCATTAWGPRMAINGNYRPRGDEILTQARMGHTQRGSFIVPIHVPLSEDVEPAEGRVQPLPATQTVKPEPSERRVTRTFAEALSVVDRVLVEPESEPTPAVLADLVDSGVSREFLTGLHKILAEEAVAAFSAEFEWAPSVPPPASLNRGVTLPSTAAIRIRGGADMMKVAPARRVEIFTGPIIEVHHEPDLPLGSVVVQGVRSAHVARVRIPVSAQRLPALHQYMQSRETMIVTGRIVRAGGELRCEGRDAVEPLSDRLLVPSSQTESD